MLTFSECFDRQSGDQGNCVTRKQRTTVSICSELSCIGDAPEIQIQPQQAVGANRAPEPAFVTQRWCQLTCTLPIQMVHTYEDAPEGHGGFDFYPERRPPTGPSIGKLVNAIFSKNPVIERVK